MPHRVGTPGCPCCECCGDSLATDDFATDLSAWTQTAGTWTLSGGPPVIISRPHFLTTSDSDAVLLLNQQLPGDQRLRVWLWLYETAPANPIVEAKVFCKWKDAQNHLYCFVQRDGSGVVTVTLHEVIAGVDSTIATASDSYATPGWLSAEHVIELCYRDGYFSGRGLTVGSDWFARGQVSDPESLGDQVGLGTGKITVLPPFSSAVLFDTFSARPSDPHCPNCVCDRCLVGTFLSSVRITFAGVSADWNTYWDALPWPTWDHTSDDERSDCAFKVQSPLPTAGGPWELRASIYRGNPIPEAPTGIYLDVEVECFGSPYQIVQWYVVLAVGATCDQIDCAAKLEEALDLTPIGTPTGIWSGATVRAVGVAEV